MRVILQRLLFLLILFAQASVIVACGSSGQLATNPIGESQKANVGMADSEEELSGPIVWKLTSDEGKTSYILANSNLVSYEQIVPEVIDLLLGSSELLLEFPDEGFFEWLSSREANLEAEIGSKHFQKLAIEVPFYPMDLLRKLPAGLVVTALSIPDRAKGPTIPTGIGRLAEKNSIPVHYLVADTTAYYSAFASVFSANDELIEALQNPNIHLKRNKKMRWAYLRGDVSGLGTIGYSDEMIAVLERENTSWLKRIHDAVRRGGAFIVVSQTDLLSPNGLLRRLRKRGYATERALPGIKASRGAQTIQSLRTSECADALLTILRLSSPQTSAPVGQDKLQTILSSELGRTFLSLCRRQTTQWHDCITDSSDETEVTDCDNKYPLVESP